jgi:dTDP-4-amino-4,6-dideoxygalactose transaminase
LPSTTPEPERTIPFARPWITDDDREAVARVLHGHVLTHGPECKAFEEEFSAFVGEPATSVTVSSCMAALHLSYLHFGLGPGDEVVAPAMTHVATAHAIEWVGATPVFVDCDTATGNVTAERIAAAVTPRTRAIAVVHYAGIPVDMPAVMEVAREHDLLVIEDCALAVNSRLDGTHAGLFGDVGTFSFYPVKHLATGEGGMFISRHPEVTAAVARLRAFGVDRRHDQRAEPGIYDVPEIGLNYRMSEMQAALGRSQLARMGVMLERRRVNFERLQAQLDGVAGVRVLDGPGNSHYCLTAVFDTVARPDLVRTLNARGVGTSVYYPHPVPRLRYYRDKYGDPAGRYPGATTISDQSIALPVGPHLSPEDADYVGEQVRRTLKELQ